MARDHPDTVAGTSNTYLARDRTFTGPRRPVPPARDPRLPRRRRMGGHPRLEQRPCRPQRHLLPSDEPVAGRLPAAPAPRDLFLVVRVCSPAVDEVVFQGALDPHTPVAQCRLRASRRRLDPELSTAHRPPPTAPTASTTAPSRWSPGRCPPGARRPAVPPEERPHPLRAVPAQRRPRPRRGDVRRAHHRPHGRGPRVVPAASGNSGGRTSPAGSAGLFGHGLVTHGLHAHRAHLELRHPRRRIERRVRQVVRPALARPVERHEDRVRADRRRDPRGRDRPAPS